MKKIILITTIALFVLIYFITQCFFVVNEKYDVIVTQFGKPVKIITNPGLYLKLPSPFQKINKFDKRIKVLNSQPIQLLLGDKNPIILTCFVAWKINNPLLFFQSIVTEENARRKINDIVNSQIGGILSNYTLNNIINTKKDMVKIKEIEDKITFNSNQNSNNNYGINIVKIGIQRISYPQIVADAIYNRMKSEREKEAEKLLAEGKEEEEKIKSETDKEANDILSQAYEQSQIIKGEGDKIALQIYASVFKKDPDFFNFLKTLDVYKKILGNNTVLIISTDSTLFKYLKKLTF